MHLASLGCSCRVSWQGALTALRWAGTCCKRFVLAICWLKGTGLDVAEPVSDTTEDGMLCTLEHLSSACSLLGLSTAIAEEWMMQIRLLNGQGQVHVPGEFRRFPQSLLRCSRKRALHPGILNALCHVEWPLYVFHRPYPDQLLVVIHSLSVVRLTGRHGATALPSWNSSCGMRRLR